MAHWLVKSEPSVYSIGDLKRDRVTHWEGVRNYQARNYLREMKPGDKLLFYHSSEEPVGVAGIAQVKSAAYPDASQFNPKDEYYDQKATKENPRWFSPDIEFVEQFSEVLPLEALRLEKSLKTMVLFQRGSRLSVQPVSEAQFAHIRGLAKGAGTSKTEQEKGKRKR